MLRKLFYLKEGELSRSMPFFALYLLLTAALTLADGLSLALFVQRAGPSQLPTFYALIAVINVLLLAWYSVSAPKVGNARVFQIILALCIAVYLSA
ncbi:MAG: hypothetical protein AB7P49_19250, partial [Bdellovibrionales bacterium]